MTHPAVLLLVALFLAGLAFFGTSSFLQEKSLEAKRRLWTESFPKGGSGTWLLRKGWSAPESWGTWSEGPLAELDWPLRDQPLSDLSMWIDGRIYPFFEEPAQSVRVLVNGTYVATLTRNFEGGLYGAKFKIPLAVATARKPMRVTFEIARPTSPKSLANGSDTRLLGIGLKSIEIEYTL